MSNTFTGSVSSYFASGLGFVSGFIEDVNLMQLGAGLLLIARLVTDVPKAIEAIAKIIARRKKHNEKKRAKRNE